MTDPRYDSHYSLNSFLSLSLSLCVGEYWAFLHFFLLLGGIL